MRAKFPVGLIGAGKFTDSPLFRTWTLRSSLGPVKSPTLRVASRIANILRAGHPVDDYREFEDCKLILISVPDKLAAKIIQEVVAQRLSWETKAVILCSQLLGASRLDALAAAGASVGSIAAIPGFDDRWFLLESDKPLEVRMRQILNPRSIRVTLVPPPLKPLYLAALACAGPLFLPLLIAASEALHRAGIPVTEASAILEKQIDRSMRSYFKAGRKVQPAAGAFDSLTDAVAAHDDRLARYLQESLRAAHHILAPGLD